MFTAKDKIGEIATKFPAAMSIFQKYGIDFCCGGDRPLAEAIEEQELDKEQLMEEINTVYQEKEAELEEINDNWEETSSSDLIDYIVGQHHTFLKDKLPEISELVIKILRVHGINHEEELTKVHRLFHNLKIDLEQHLLKEEEIVFPAIKKYEQNTKEEKQVNGFSRVDELKHEHDQAGDIIKELREVTADYNVPDDGCKTYERTYQLLEELETDLFQHIHLENNILFTRLKQ
ncbi:iron-sulfur cluster repair di-iron protein [Halobacteroides halobius DSM 5150]|uniref:Iron-sulfur cluster repair di-iron protein n=1 Tax=Halobacteroides halobius (strain ATCC 35273 / DSM 5150 / MD-1) TaxID=748449 RepID=L0K7T0_HALHC|nr:iron-sulfur cluster repair di-iron protein [Halobacteroides halobius]AGB40409.1 iron-sulfur cluster repair di-iron protein [Halobacteroides halobius DSM 5150]